MQMEFSQDFCVNYYLGGYHYVLKTPQNNKQTRKQSQQNQTYPTPKTNKQTKTKAKQNPLGKFLFSLSFHISNSHELTCGIYTSSESGPESPAIEYYITNIKSLCYSIFVHKYNPAQMGSHFWLILLPTQHIQHDVSFT